MSQTAELASLIMRCSVGLMLLLYGGYCWFKQGTHVRGKGWKTKSESPKVFLFSVIFYVIFGLVMLIGNIMIFLR